MILYNVKILFKSKYCKDNKITEGYNDLIIVNYHVYPKIFNEKIRKFFEILIKKKIILGTLEDDDNFCTVDNFYKTPYNLIIKLFLKTIKKAKNVNLNKDIYD